MNFTFGGALDGTTFQTTNLNGSLKIFPKASAHYTAQINLTTNTRLDRDESSKVVPHLRYASQSTYHKAILNATQTSMQARVLHQTDNHATWLHCTRLLDVLCAQAFHIIYLIISVYGGRHNGQNKTDLKGYFHNCPIFEHYSTFQRKSLG